MGSVFGANNDLAYYGFNGSASPASNIFRSDKYSYCMSAKR